MKAGIHPEYVDTTITCACGEVIQTRSTKPDIRVEVCSKCHPYYTGKQKFMDTAGRVERFQRKYKRGAAATPGGIPSGNPSTRWSRTLNRVVCRTPALSVNVHSMSYLTVSGNRLNLTAVTSPSADSAVW